MPTFRTPAVILRAYDYAEADRILVLFTLGQGKLRAVAKGVRRLSSRLAGGLSLFSLAELQLHGAEHRELALVTQSQLLHSYPKLKSDLAALGGAARMAELVAELVPDRQPLPEVFRLLVGGWELLEDGQALDAASAWFEASLLDRLGYRPRLETCGACGGDGETAGLAYHPEAGGVFCRRCRASGGLPLSAGSRRLLVRLMDAGPDWARCVRLSAETGREVGAVLEAALHQQLGRSLRSDTFRRAVAGLE